MRTVRVFGVAGLFALALGCGSSGAGGPVVTGVAPAIGVPGEDAWITGSGFGPTQGASVVTFAGLPSTSVSRWTDTEIVAQIPSTATTGDVVVTVRGDVTVGGESSPPVEMVLTAPGAGMTFLFGGCRVVALATQADVGIVIPPGDPGNSTSFTAIHWRADGSELWTNTQDGEVWSIPVDRDPVTSRVLRLGRGHPVLDAGIAVMGSISLDEGPGDRLYFAGPLSSGLVVEITDPLGTPLLSSTWYSFDSTLTSGASGSYGLQFDTAKLGPDTALVSRSSLVATVPFTFDGTDYVPGPSAVKLQNATYSSGAIQFVPRGANAGRLMVAGTRISTPALGRLLLYDWPPSSVGEAPVEFALKTGGAISGLDFDPITGDLFFIGANRTLNQNAIYQVSFCP